MRTLLKIALVALTLTWLAHAGKLPLAAPWHPFVPWVWWSVLISLFLTTPFPSEEDR